MKKLMPQLLKNEESIQFGLNPRISLFPFQKKGIEELKNGKRVLCDEMGLGKTIQTIAYLHHLRSSDSESPSLIVVPTPEFSGVMSYMTNPIL